MQKTKVSQSTNVKNSLLKKKNSQGTAKPQKTGGIYQGSSKKS